MALLSLSFDMIVSLLVAIGSRPADAFRVGPVRKLSSEGVRQTPVLVVISIKRTQAKELRRDSR
jgi:hypothetical protein